MCDKKFATLSFKCKLCNEKNTIDLMAGDKHNHTCECGAFYWVNKTKGWVRYVNKKATT